MQKLLMGGWRRWEFSESHLGRLRGGSSAAPELGGGVFVVKGLVVVVVVMERREGGGRSGLLLNEVRREQVRAAERSGVWRGCIVDDG